MRRAIKKSQLWLHHHYAEVRHWLIVVIGVILLIFSMISLSNQNRLNQRVATLAVQNKILSEQNKVLNEKSTRLGEENQSIAKQNRSYTRCLATVFALYTHNFVPVEITDLDTCTTDSQSNATNNSPTGGTSSSGSEAPSSASQKPSSGGSSSPNNAPSNGNGQSNNSQPEPVRILGIPACLPLTNVCARQ